MGRKEKALHISFDYPDDLNPHKPKAVKNLIEQANRLDNFVISLNRTGNPFQEKTINNPNLWVSFKSVYIPKYVVCFTANYPWARTEIFLTKLTSFRMSTVKINVCSTLYILNDISLL